MAHVSHHLNDVFVDDQPTLGVLDDEHGTLYNVLYAPDGELFWSLDTMGPYDPAAEGAGTPLPPEGAGYDLSHMIYNEFGDMVYDPVNHIGANPAEAGAEHDPMLGS